MTAVYGQLPAAAPMLLSLAMTDDNRSGTWVTFDGSEPTSVQIRRCQLQVVSGPDAGLNREFSAPTIRIGAHQEADLVLTDRKVSGTHVEIALDERGYRVRDLESTNGTFIHGIRVNDAYVPPGTTISIGKTELRFVPLNESVSVPLWPEPQFHSLIGRSVPMRRLFSILERIATTDATVLIDGETGAGKELIADAIHQQSHRADGPFVVIDCGAVPPNLFESELFGHEKGAYTGAVSTKPGAFERAHGGTLFLDELGELPLEMQPKLLRAVQSKQVRRVGGSQLIDCDVRLVAATNRDLAVEVNRGNFRDDLYYRIAVARVHVPPLRERKEDIALLVDHFVGQLGTKDRALPDDFVARARDYSWPGNVRELRNAVERALILPNHPAAFGAVAPARVSNGDGWPPIDIELPFKVAKKQFVDEFDRRFTRALLDRHDWNISAAARAAGVDRMSIYKLLQRLGLERE